MVSGRTAEQAADEYGRADAASLLRGAFLAGVAYVLQEAERRSKELTGELPIFGGYAIPLADLREICREESK